MKKNSFRKNCVITGTEREKEILSTPRPTPVQKALSFIKKYWPYTWKVIKLISMFFAGAMVWVALGDIAPSLRESTPNFYKITDMIVGWWDTICSLLCKLLGLSQYKTPETLVSGALCFYIILLFPQFQELKFQYLLLFLHLLFS